jgi:hypothetical protein
MRASRAAIAVVLSLTACGDADVTIGPGAEQPIPVDVEAAGALTLAQPDADVAATAKVEEPFALDEATAGYAEEEVQGRQTALVLANDPMKAGINPRRDRGRPARRRGRGRT